MKKLIVLVGIFTHLFLFAQERKVDLKTEEIIFVFKTHFDIGYTDFAEAVLQKYSTSMIEGALDVLEASKGLPEEQQFVWTLPAWPMHEILKRAEPEIREKVEAAVRQGRFVIHALPFTFETEASDAENLARSFAFATEISTANGLDLPRDAKLTDVPSHSWFLPTLLTHAGVQILHLGCNPASSSPEIPLLFWWEGPDGSRLMTMYWGGYYGTSLTPPEGWPYKTWLAIIHTNDNQGAPSSSDVEKILDEAHTLAPNARLRMGRISDFYDALMKENPDLPVVRGDMPDTWIHGYMSMPKEVKISRAIRKDMVSMEALNSLLSIWNGASANIGETIANAAESSLLFDEHTFGLAMSHGHSGYWCYGDEFKTLRAQGVFKPIEDSWNEKADRVYQAEKILNPGYDKQLRTLAQSVNAEGQRIVVYNPLPWERDGLVTLQVSSVWNPIKVLKDSETGKTFNVENKGNVIRFFAEDIPPMGYRTYTPTDEVKEKSSGSLKADGTANILENRFYTLALDPENGTIISITDKRSGRELIDPESPYHFGQYLYERFSKKDTEGYTKEYVKGGWEWSLAEMGRPNLSDEPYKASSGKMPKIEWSVDHLSASATMLFAPHKDMPHDYVVIFRLYANLPFIEMTWSINDKPAEPWPEAGWICFPLNIKNPDFRLGRLGGIVDPVKDFIRGSNLDYGFINTGLAVVDKNGKGMGVCSPDVPAVSLDRPGLWRHSTGFVPERPNVFLNLYNNQWSTNFTEWIEGSWSARVYLWSIDNYDNESSIITPSENIRVPLKAVLVSGKPGTLPVSETGIRLSRKGILVTAFQKNSDGDGALLRLWESAGITGECVITLPDGSSFTSASPTDLRGRETGASIPVINNAFNVIISRYAPVTLRLK